MTGTVDPGPVPDHDPADVVPTTAEYLAGLRYRAGVAQEWAAWEDPTTPAGQRMVADAAVELARIVGELLAIVGRGEITQPRDAR